MVRPALGVTITGVAFGFALSRIGFSAWDEVHRMFTFADWRLTLAFAFAVTLLIPAWWGLKRAGQRVEIRRKFHRGTLIGGMLFGAGWAITGGCPSISAVQLGEGQLGALWTLIGMFAGNWLYSVVHARYFRWPTTSCVDA